MRFLNVFAQDVAAEVALEIAPGGVNVVGAVLRVGVFEQKSRALNAVVMRFKGLGAAGPREADFGQPGFLNLSPVFLGDNGSVAVDVFLNKLGSWTCWVLSRSL